MATPEQPARAARVLDDLYRRHAAEVFRYTYAVLGNRADAEDITQATFVNALRALERGERPRKPANWLLAIAHNLMRQRFRQDRARPVQVLLDGDLPRAALTEDDATPSVGELVGALGRIPVSQREAIVMREFEGRSYAEIAEILGVTTSALETLLFRARRSLAEELDNLVTCARAEQDVSRLLDGRLSRRERKRLQEHVKTCPACARFEAFQRKQRRALKGLALLPLPVSLTLFKGAHGASAAGLPTIGTGAAATTAAGVGAAASGGSVVGGLALTGVATKAAVVVAAVAVAGGVGYEGVTHAPALSHQPVRSQGRPTAPAGATSHQKTASKNARHSVAHAGKKNGKTTSSNAARAHLQHVGAVARDTTAPHGNAGGKSTTAPGHSDTLTGSSAAAPGRTGTKQGNAGGASTSHANSNSTTAKQKTPDKEKTSTGPQNGTGKSSSANGNAKSTATSNTNTTPTTPNDTSTDAPPAATSNGNGNATGATNAQGSNGNGNGTGSAATKGNSK